MRVYGAVVIAGDGPPKAAAPTRRFIGRRIIYGVLSEDESVGAAPLGGPSHGTSGAIGKPFLNFLRRLCRGREHLPDIGPACQVVRVDYAFYLDIVHNNLCPSNYKDLEFTAIQAFLLGPRTGEGLAAAR